MDSIGVDEPSIWKFDFGSIAEETSVCMFEVRFLEAERWLLDSIDVNFLICLEDYHQNIGEEFYPTKDGEEDERSSLNEIEEATIKAYSGGVFD